MSRRMLINLKNVSIRILDRMLFENLSLTVHAGELLALVGANGCGKSTILQLITSAEAERPAFPEEADVRVTGEVFLDPHSRIMLLPQAIKPGREPLNDPIEPAGPEYAALEARLRGEFQLSGDSTALDTLSDGELQKLAIIKMLLSDADILLFDEPTNYLDIAGITAFESHLDRLKRAGKAIIVVTHDRALTDNLADHTVLVTPHGIYHAAGGSTLAWSVRGEQMQARRHQAREIGKKIRQLQEDTRAKAGWAAQKERQKKGAGMDKPHIGRLSKKMAKRAKAVQRRVDRHLDKLKGIKPFVPKELSLRFPDREIRHREVFALNDVCFSYTEQPEDSPGKEPYLLEDVTLSATTRDKICLMGANGSGKTTVFRLIQGHVAPLAGSRRFNSGVKTAYVPQGLAGFFPAKRLLDNFGDCGCDETTIRQHLGAALIRRDKVHRPTSSFSYGELMRAAVVKCLLSQGEFLFLDEPTTHLDIESIEVLEKILDGFAGGFLIISHDRRFIENVADRLYVLDGGRPRLL
ncbi:MAG: ATP-binding cassette domain-containing protein [candidate division Zixibacteria bacterium]|nr:ATP-binding cassette domain-containing protein [candidate division Zixibacteria bacterium]